MTTLDRIRSVSNVRKSVKRNKGNSDFSIYGSILVLIFICFSLFLLVIVASKFFTSLMADLESQRFEADKLVASRLEERGAKKEYRLVYFNEESALNGKRKEFGTADLDEDFGAMDSGGVVDANSIDGYRGYVFRFGDTAKSIAKKFGMDANELAVINGFDNGRHINFRIGERILVIDRRKRLPDLSGTILSGLTSWYGPGFDGRRSASGEIYDMNSISMAHKTLPLGTEVDVYAGGKVVRGVKIKDRGPYIRGRNFDVSKALAEKLNIKKKGVAKIKVVVK